MSLLKGDMALNKEVKTKKLFDCKTPYLCKLFDSSEYPWEILPKTKEYIYSLIEEGIQGYKKIADGVLVGKNVKIYPTAIIEGPTIIGEGTEEISFYSGPKIGGFLNGTFI